MVVDVEMQLFATIQFWGELRSMQKRR